MKKKIIFWTSKIKSLFTKTNEWIEFILFFVSLFRYTLYYGVHLKHLMCLVVSCEWAISIIVNVLFVFSLRN